MNKLIINNKLEPCAGGLRCPLLFAFVLVLSIGCTDRKITVTPANPRLDPLPQLTLREELGSDGLDPLLGEQWAVEKLGLAQVWSQPGSSPSRRVIVAVLSTGIDYNHEDLASNIYLNIGESNISHPAERSPLDGEDNDKNGYVDDWAGYDFIDNDGLPYDLTGIGTAAAGVIGAVHKNGKGIRGVVSRLSLLPVRYINTNGETTIPNLIRALKYCIAIKPDVIYLQVANIKFTDSLQVLADAEFIALNESLKIISTQNTPVIVNAGNTATDLSRSKSLIRALSEHQNVLVITSVDEKDHRPFIANYGMETVVTASPGVNIMTTLPGNQYGRESGSSIAAAFVTGAIAIAVNKHFGNLPVSKIRSTILSKAGSDVLPEMELETLGGNRLNVLKFLNALE